MGWEEPDMMLSMELIFSLGNFVCPWAPQAGDLSCTLGSSCNVKSNFQDAECALTGARCDMRTACAQVSPRKAPLCILQEAFIHASIALEAPPYVWEEEPFLAGCLEIREGLALVLSGARTV